MTSSLRKDIGDLVVTACAYLAGVGLWVLLSGERNLHADFWAPIGLFIGFALLGHTVHLLWARKRQPHQR